MADAAAEAERPQQHLHAHAMRKMPANEGAGAAPDAAVGTPVERPAGLAPGEDVLDRNLVVLAGDHPQPVPQRFGDAAAPGALRRLVAPEIAVEVLVMADLVLRDQLGEAGQHRVAR